MMKKRTQYLLFIFLFSTLSVACNVGNDQPTGTPPVVQLMPDLPGYDVIEGQVVQDYIASLAKGAALLAGNPELAVLVTKIDSVVACYREVGAVNARLYSDEAFPLSSGAIAIADRNRLADPETLFRCIGGRFVPLSSKPELNPCSHSYTLERDNNEFYIIYAGTTQEICHTFCVNLEGCSGH